MNNPNKKRLRRTMMFLNAQKPGLIKDPYIYKADSLMLDLEDAVAENQKDVARFSLYHALKTVDYRGAERVVRINGLDTPYWREPAGTDLLLLHVFPCHPSSLLHDHERFLLRSHLLRGVYLSVQEQLQQIPYLYQAQPRSQDHVRHGSGSLSVP